MDDPLNGGGETGRARILLAIPNAAHAGALARRLSEAGMRCMVASSVQLAIAELHRGPIDLVIAELRDGTFSGAELVSLMRSDCMFRDLPVYVVTARTDSDEAIQALRDGADAMVRKPFQLDALAAQVSRELERKRSIDALKDDNRRLDARIVERALELHELKDRLAVSEAERERLRQIVEVRPSR